MKPPPNAPGRLPHPYPPPSTPPAPPAPPRNHIAPPSATACAFRLPGPLLRRNIRPSRLVLFGIRHRRRRRAPFSPPRRALHAHHHIRLAGDKNIIPRQDRRRVRRPDPRRPFHLPLQRRSRPRK